MARGALEQIPPDFGASPPAGEVPLVSPGDGGVFSASSPDGAVPHHKLVSKPSSASPPPSTST